MKGFSVFAAFVGTVMMIIALIIGLTFIQNHITLNKIAMSTKSDTELYNAIQEIRALVYSSMNYQMLKHIKENIESKNPFYRCDTKKECMNRALGFINDVKNYAQSGAIIDALSKIQAVLTSRGIHVIRLTPSVASMPPKLISNESGTYIVFNSTNITAQFRYKGKTSTIEISSPINYTMKLPWDFVHIVNTTANITGPLIDKVEKEQIKLIASCFCNCTCKCGPYSCWCEGCSAEDRSVVADVITVWNGNHRHINSKLGGHTLIDYLGCSALLDLTNESRAKKDLFELLDKSLAQNLSKYYTDHNISLQIEYNITVDPTGGDEDEIKDKKPGVKSGDRITDGVCESFAEPGCCGSYYIIREFIITNISVKLNLTSEAECSSTGEPKLNLTIGFTNK